MEFVTCWKSADVTILHHSLDNEDVWLSQDWENPFIAPNISQRQLLSGVSASYSNGEQAPIKGM